MKYNLSYGDRKSIRFNIIKHFYQPQLETGLHTRPETKPNNKPDFVKFGFLPSDPDELVYQFKLIVFEKEQEIKILCSFDKLSQLLINYYNKNALQQINTKTLSQLSTH